MPDQLATTTSNCTVNGQSVPCAELAHQAGTFLKWGIGGALILFIIFAIITIFWIMMLVHAASHAVPNKAIWIIAMLLTGIVGAVVYYFAVKRNFVPAGSMGQSSAAPSSMPPVPPTEPPVSPIV